MNTVSRLLLSVCDILLSSVCYKQCTCIAQLTCTISKTSYRDICTSTGFVAQIRMRPAVEVQDSVGIYTYMYMCLVSK